MTDFLKMDVFFVVATVVAVLVGTLLVVALVQLVRFLRTLNRIGDEFAEEASALRVDLSEARSSIKANGLKLASLSTLLGVGKRAVARRKRKTSST